MNLRRGSSTLEMTLVGIPLIFVLISVFEMSRGMWIYHTMAYAIKEGTRYSIVHGNNCDPTVNTNNNCQVTVGQIAQVIQNAGVGLDPTDLQVQMTSLNQTISMQSLSTLLTSTTKFPTGTGGIQTAALTFNAQYPFLNALSMFWPGKQNSWSFQQYTCQSGTFCIAASSTDNIEF